MDVAVQYVGANLISCVRTIVFIYKAFVLRLRYSDQKGPDINGLNKEFLNNYSSYTFQL